MKKIYIVMLLVFSIISFAEARNISRPNIDKSILNRFSSYMKDSRVEAFVCSNNTGSYIMAKKGLGLAYTNNKYYMYNNSGVSFPIAQCEPARFER